MCATSSSQHAVPGCSNDRRVAADARKRRSALVDTRFVTVFFRNERQERGDRFTVDVVVYDRAISPTRDLIRVRQPSCHTALAGIGERRRPIAGRLQTVEPSRQRVAVRIVGHGCEDAVADRDHTGAAARADLRPGIDQNTRACFRERVGAGERRPHRSDAIERFRRQRHPGDSNQASAWRSTSSTW